MTCAYCSKSAVYVCPCHDRPYCVDHDGRRVLAEVMPGEFVPLTRSRISLEPGAVNTLGPPRPERPVEPRRLRDRVRDAWDAFWGDE